MMKILDHLKPLILGEQYTLRLAESANDLIRVQKLRFEVFNVEMKEGLASSDEIGLDVDEFDEVCSHLLVEHAETNEVVGTYRMQTGLSAERRLGYYTAKEFDLKVFEAHRPELLELGRACIHQAHRNFSVLSMLWRGIATYAQENGARYLIGCSSLSSQNVEHGWSAFHQMHSNRAPIEFQTTPTKGYECGPSMYPGSKYKIPKLLSAYLSLGAWICSPPALDRNFKTIDFLTLMDLKSENMALRRKRFGIN
jgi:putative hemolysin